MLNNRVKTIIKREVRSQVMSKTFIIMTILVPIIISIVSIIPTLAINFKSNDKFFVQIISEDDSLLPSLEAKFKEENFVTSGQFNISYNVLSSKDIESYVNDIRKDLVNKDISGLFYIPDSAKENKTIKYYSTNPKNRDITENIRATINDVLITNYFKNKDINVEDINYTKRNVSIDRIKITSSGNEDDNYVTLIIALIFTFFLFLSVMIIGQSIMQAVTEEKNNRVVEVLLSSVNPTELMTGKIVGTAITGMLQMLIWFTPVIIFTSGSLPFMAAMGIDISIDFSFLHYFFLNYIIGLLIYLGLFSAFGAIFDNAQDAQQGIWPLMMLILIPFYLVFTIFSNPSNAIAEIGSMLPFSSIMLMPVRMAILNLPWWQPVIAISVNILTLITILFVAGKIYKIGIMTTGKKPKWSEVIKWVKQS
jgi:ABC-2 type transport system permease protein